MKVKKKKYVDDYTKPKYKTQACINCIYES